VTDVLVSRPRPTSDLTRLVLALGLSAAVAFAGRGTVAEVLSLWTLGESANAYFLPDLALSLYVMTPLAALATSLFFLGPGLILTAVTGRDKSLGLWLLAAVPATMAVLTAGTTLAQLALGTVLIGNAFFLLVLALNAAAVVFAGLRLAAGGGLRLRLAGQGGDIVTALALFWAVLVLMAPKFYWENFSGDGSGSLQFARNFIHTLWPFWSPEAGVIKQAPGLTSMLFVLPESWFVRLWGETEFSVRVPHLMALTLLYPVLTALIRTGRDRVELRAADHLLIAATLGLYSLAVIYSGGYHPWFGDSPMPAARETLAMVFFMGYILAFAEDRRGLMLTAGLMGHLTLPTGGLWLLMWPVAVALVWRPVPRDRLIFALYVLGAAAAVSVLGPVLVRLSGLPIPGNEFSLQGIVQRLRFVAVTDWQRFAFLAVPVGILPVFALFAWKAQDRLSRALTLLTAAFFLFFYFQGYRVLLHHFIPAMFPPLIVLWRLPVMRIAAGRLAAAAGLAAGLWLAWPNDTGLHDHDRAFAAHIQTEGPLFASAEPVAGERFRGFEPAALDVFHELFGRLLPIGYGDREPSQRFFGAPLVWFYYSEFPKAEGQVINYVIKPVEDAIAEDGKLFSSHLGYGLYIRDMALFDQHRTMKLPIDTGAPILSTPRQVIFGMGARWPENWTDRTVIDLVAIAKRVLGKG
jgi:hypothetical protein